MDQTEREAFISQKYKQEEELMILLFAQWCINHDLEPEGIYQKAFPSQSKNAQLTHAVEQTIPKSEADEIPLVSLLEVLSWFEQDELAFIVSEEASRLDKG